MKVAKRDRDHPDFFIPLLRQRSEGLKKHSRILQGVHKQTTGRSKEILSRMKRLEELIEAAKQRLKRQSNSIIKP